MTEPNIDSSAMAPKIRRGGLGPKAVPLAIMSMTVGDFVNSRHDAWLGDCDTFTVNPCTTAQKDFFEELGIKMGFTDFRPATVNWAVPVAWRGAGGCKRRAARSNHFPHLPPSRCPQPASYRYLR